MLACAGLAGELGGLLRRRPRITPESMPGVAAAGDFAGGRRAKPSDADREQDRTVAQCQRPADMAAHMTALRLVARSIQPRRRCYPGRFRETGMHCVRLTVSGEEAGLLLLSEGLCGAEERLLPDGRVALELYFADAGDAARVGAWEEAGAAALAYQDHWTGLAVGTGWWLQPAGDPSPVPEGRTALRMMRGPVFGAGDHPTTRLCLAMLERHASPEDIVLDAGTGSGILAVAAAHLGVRCVVACDIDPVAVAAAARAIAGAGARAGLWLGSWDCCRAGRVSLVCANLPGGFLIDAVPSLAACCAPGARWILSGFLGEQAGELEAALDGVGAGVVERAAEGEWGAVAARLPR